MKKYHYIYKITNLVNGKMYIGKHSTNNLDDGYMGSGFILKRAMKKYGVQNFKKEIQGFYEDVDELNYYERVFVDETWLSRSDTYNLCIGGKGTCGRACTEKTRKKIGMANTGRRHTEDWKMKVSQKLRGMKRSESFKQKLKEANIGKHLSEEQKRKLSESAKERFKDPRNHPMYGKKCSKETIERLRQMARDYSLGCSWWNNGVVNKFCPECPDGFVKGRIYKGKVTNSKGI